MEWTAEDIVRLRKLWSEGHSTRVIGRMMGFTKNAIVGKAHRLGLTGRESPIKHERTAPKQPRPVRRPKGGTLPALQSTAEPLAVIVDLDPLPPPAPIQSSPAEPTPPEVPVLVEQAAAPKPAYVPSRRDCCWPIGEPGRPGFRFCCDDAVIGKPYCETHCKIAYPPARLREHIQSKVESIALRADRWGKARKAFG